MTWGRALVLGAALCTRAGAQEPAAEDKARALLAEANAQRDVQRRIALLEEAVRLAPSAELHIELGAAFEATGQRWPDARAQYRRAYELALAHEQSRAAALLLGQIANTHLKQDHPLEALKAMEAAHALAPNEDKLDSALRDLRLRMTQRRLSAEELQRGFLAARQYDMTPSVDVYVRFDFDSARLSAEGEAQADELGEALQAQELRAVRFEIVGHTDRIGADDYNLSLSARRAAAVGKYLCSRFGFAESRFRISGKGKREPLDARANAAADAINRRVQVLLLDH